MKMASNKFEVRKCRLLQRPEGGSPGHMMAFPQVAVGTGAGTGAPLLMTKRGAPAHADHSEPARSSERCRT